MRLSSGGGRTAAVRFQSGATAFAQRVVSALRRLTRRPGIDLDLERGQAQRRHVKKRRARPMITQECAEHLPGRSGSTSPTRYVVSLTISPIAMPAASRLRRTLSSATSICSAGSVGKVPSATSQPARTTRASALRQAPRSGGYRQRRAHVRRSDCEPASPPPGPAPNKPPSPSGGSDTFGKPELYSTSGAVPSASSSGSPFRMESAMTPAFCRIAASISLASASFSRRNCLEFSRP